MATGDGAVATIINLQNAASAVNGTVKFDMTAAQEFVANQNWVGLETYLSEFLTNVQGDKFYHHPGLFRSLYQAQISSLIEAKQFEEARDVFKDKVRPLVAHREDLYAPLDLEYRVVAFLGDCVRECLPPSDDDVEDMNVVLSDYMMLYFPTSLQNGAKRTNSVLDFLVTLDDEEGKQHRCLACHRVMPAPVTTKSIVSHVEDMEDDESCPKATEWMREYLAHHVKIEKETDSTASSSRTQSRKRKAPLSPLPSVPADLSQQSDVIRLGLVVPICGDLMVANMSALSLLAPQEDKSQSAAKTEALEILFRQDELTTELKRLLFSKPVDSSLAFLNIKTLRNLTDDLWPLLKSLPADVSELLLKQDRKITELRRLLMLAAAGRLPTTGPVHETSSSTGSC